MSWGYRIDYEKEIAEDQRVIKMLETAIQNRWFCSSRHLTYVWDLALQDPGIALDLGLTHKDLADLFAAVDDLMTKNPFETDGVVADYKRGHQVLDRLYAVYPEHLYTEAKTRNMLRSAKTSLSRHKRNQKLNG